MSDLCKSCRWPVRLHHSGTLGCPPGVHLDASADEMWAWLAAHGRIEATQHNAAGFISARLLGGGVDCVQIAPTLSAALRAVCAEVLST